MAQVNDSLLQRLCAASPAIIYSYTFRSGKPAFTFISDNVRQILGYSPDEFMSRFDLWKECMHADDLPRVASKLASYHRDHQVGESCYLEFRFRDKEGTFHWFADRQHSLLDGNGHTVFVGAKMDITDSKQQEKAILQAMPDILFLMEKNGTFLDIYTNDANRLLAPPDEALGKTLHDFFPGEMAREHLALYRKSIAESATQVTEYSIPLKGREAYFEARISPVNQDQVLAIVRDITQVKTAHRALKESEARYRDLVEDISDVIFELQPDGIISFMSPVIRNIAGIEASEYVGKHFSAFLDPRDRGDIDRAFRAIQAGRHFPSEYRIQNRMSRDIWVRSSTKAVKGRQGEVVYRGIAQDITREKENRLALIRAKEKAEESDRLKSAFLATMNHELRTPLNHVIGFSEVIKSHSSQDNIREYAGIVHKSGNKLLSIIEDIFDLAMSEDGIVSLKKEEVRGEEIYAEGKASLEHYLASSGKSDRIRLNFKPHQQILESGLIIDRGKLFQILTNLFKNAIKYTDEGEITFGFHPGGGDELHLFVRDTGVGIPADKQEIVFDFFRRADESHSSKHDGVGIGLAISKRLAHVMKGRIVVESAEGVGSTFTLSIPLEVNV